MLKETEVTSTPTKPVDNVVIATKGLQDRSTNITAGTTVENKGKLILNIYLCLFSIRCLNPINFGFNILVQQDFGSTLVF